MNLYEETVMKELLKWRKEIAKKPGFFSTSSKAVQKKMHDVMPGKIQDAITAGVKGMVDMVLTGSSMLTETRLEEGLSLAESDFLVEKTFKNYYKIAMAQGIGFGLGGILINLADIPALLSIKVKFLFDCAKLYGYDVDEPSERLFMLYVFQLAFSGDDHRAQLVPMIFSWEAQKQDAKLDWEILQKEYRDYLDIAKLLQNLPVVGAVAGGYANHTLMEKLKMTAMNCYRYRRLSESRELSAKMKLIQ